MRGGDNRYRRRGVLDMGPAEHCGEALEERNRRTQSAAVLPSPPPSDRNSPEGEVETEGVEVRVPNRRV